MKYKYDLVWLDRVDEDRWWISSIVSVIFLSLVFLLISEIRIPELPKKPKVIEEIEFVKEEIEKKVVTKTITTVKPEVEKEIFEDEPEEIVIDVFKEIEQEQNLNFDLIEANDLQIVPEENPDMMPSQAEIQITEGEFMEESEIDPIQVPQGVTEWDQDYSETRIVTNDEGNQSVERNGGLSTAPKDYDPTKPLTINGFKGVIKWEEYYDPILSWIKLNHIDIGGLPRLEMTGGDPTVNTAKAKIKVDGQDYDLYLVSKETKKQLTICLVNLETDDYFMLIDQGLTRTSNSFRAGSVKRGDNNEITRFKRSRQRADDPRAKKFEKVFWAWAESIK